MSNALPWFKVEVLQVANDLSDVKSLEGEGAYFRVLRHLWLNGPQPIEQLRRKCQHVFDELEHVFINCSTDVEQLFSIPWLENQRVKADEWRANKSVAGKKSAEVRASRSKTRNRRSTGVEQPTSTSISSSFSTQEGKERAEAKTLFGNSRFMSLDVIADALPELVKEGVDLTHYRDAIHNWSDTKDEKRSDRGWLATFRQWTKTDRDKRELKTLKPVSTGWNPRA